MESSGTQLYKCQMNKKDESTVPLIEPFDWNVEYLLNEVELINTILFSISSPILSCLSIRDFYLFYEIYQYWLPFIHSHFPKSPSPSPSPAPAPLEDPASLLSVPFNLSSPDPSSPSLSSYDGEIDPSDAEMNKKPIFVFNFMIKYGQLILLDDISLLHPYNPFLLFSIRDSGNFLLLPIPFIPITIPIPFPLSPPLLPLLSSLPFPLPFLPSPLPPFLYSSSSSPSPLSPLLFLL